MLRRVLEILRRINPFRTRNEVMTLADKVKTANKEVEKISKRQLEIREESIRHIQSNRINKLSPEQEEFVLIKAQKINLDDSWQEFTKIKRIVSSIEFLDTNSLIADKKTLKFERIEQDLLHLLREPLIKTNEPVDLTKKFVQKRLEVEEIRKAEIERNKNLWRDIKSYSLIEIHKQREKERIEKEKADRERELYKKYTLHIKESSELLYQNDFDAALKQLTIAANINPNKQEEIDAKRKSILDKKNEFENLKKEFEVLFSSGEQAYQTGSFEKAIDLFKRARKLGINKIKCDNRLNSILKEVARLRAEEIEMERKEREERLVREKYKDDGDAILKYLHSYGINEFYHYTDARNINSILQNSGLFSLKQLKNKGISFVQGSETSELSDYVRLSYTQRHPLMYVSTREGRISKVVVMSIEDKVATLKGTRFSNVNAARSSNPPVAKFGDDLEFIKGHVRMNIVKRKDHFDLAEEEKPYYQAEVLIKDHLPLDLIKSL